MTFSTNGLSLPLLTSLLSGACLLGGVSIASSAPSPFALSTLAAIPNSTTIRIEGEPMRVTLQRYRPRGVPIEMGIPEGDFKPSVASNDRYARVRLVASRRGQVTTDQARINLLWFKDSINVSRANEELLDFANARQIRLEKVQGAAIYPWQEQRWRFSDRRAGIVGEALIGQFNGQPFLVVHQLPVDMVEGYAPRIRAVLKTLQAR